MGNYSVSWKSKNHTIVATFSAEVVYRAMAATMSELLWLSYILKDLYINVHLSIPLYCDKQVVIRIMENHVLHERTKHIGIYCHFVRRYYVNGFVQPSHISSYN